MTRKWRPSLALLISTVLGLVLCLPLGGLFLFQFYANQLIQQTEESLLAQASLLAADFAESYTLLDDGIVRGNLLPPTLVSDQNERYRPVAPGLSLGSSVIAPPRSDALPAASPVDAIYSQIGVRLSAVSKLAQTRTLAGYRVVDASGTVIGGTSEVGSSLAHVPEVAAALQGETQALLRLRISDEPTPPVYSVSRGTRIRVFVAMPVVVRDRVIGAVYVSRTPNNIVRYVYEQRKTLIWVGVVVLFCTVLIGVLFWRFVSRPIHNLIRCVNGIAAGDPAALTPLRHYGTSEVAVLGRNLLSMAETLTNRQEAVQTFTAHVTHELKSPLTSVSGAAELLLDQAGGMADEDRQRFLTIIARDSQRMTRLLDKLRDLAKARLPATAGQTALEDVVVGLGKRFPAVTLRIESEHTVVPMAREGLEIALGHLIENSVAHGADTVRFRLAYENGTTVLEVLDNGTGISAANRGKVLDPFFTTRRDDGGTGMGLSIVASMLSVMAGRVEVLDPDQGAGIRLHFAED